MKKYKNTINRILSVSMILVSRLWCTSELPGSIPEDIEQTRSALPPRTPTDAAQSSEQNTIGASSTGQSYQEYIALAVELAQEQLQKLYEERLGLERYIQSQGAGQSTSEMLDLESGGAILQRIEEQILRLNRYIQLQGLEDQPIPEVLGSRDRSLESGEVIPPPIPPQSIPPQPTMIARLDLMLRSLRSIPTSAREVSWELDKLINVQMERIAVRGESLSALAELSDSVRVSNNLEWYRTIKFAFECLEATIVTFFFLNELHHRIRPS
jgi:hypothetical protein